MYFLFDIGGTKMRFAMSSDGIYFGEPLIFDNPNTYEDGLKVVGDAFLKLSLGGTIVACAGGVAGTFNKEHSHIVRSPHMPQWVGKSVKQDIERIVKAPVYLANDSALVGLGEAVQGAGQDFDIVAYITVSTGVGGARIVSKKMDQGSMGFEPGHQIIDCSGAVEPRFNVTGTLEDFVSGSALARQMNKKVTDISADDPVWDDLAEKLSYGIYNSILHWSPDVVVLGGSMITGSPAISVEAVSRYLRDINRVYDVLPQIKKADLQAVGGLHGALTYLKQQL